MDFPDSYTRPADETFQLCSDEITDLKEGDWCTEAETPIRFKWAVERGRRVIWADGLHRVPGLRAKVELVEALCVQFCLIDGREEKRALARELGQFAQWLRDHEDHLARQSAPRTYNLSRMSGLAVGC